MRRTLLRFLRATHLIQFADRYAAHRAVDERAQANGLYRAVHSTRTFPDPALIFEVAGHASLKSYDTTGERDAAEIAALLRETILPAAPRILDWGCGPGRVLAHLPAALNAPDARFQGCDPNPRAIAFASNALPHLAFEHINATPPTPFANARFDAIYGISILTHLPEAKAQSWIAELARLVTDSGAVILTSHGEDAAAHLGPAARIRFDAAAYVEIGGAAAGSRTYVSYFNEAAGRRLFAPHFKIIDFRPATGDGIGHDIWLLRAPRRSGKA